MTIYRRLAKIMAARLTQIRAMPGPRISTTQEPEWRQAMRDLLAMLDAEWLDIVGAPRDRTAVIVAVPALHRPGEWFVGEAYFDPDSSREGDWWWAGTSNGEYHDSPIRETNAEPLFYRLMPGPPKGKPK